MTKEEKKRMWRFIMVNREEVLEGILHDKANEFMDDIGESVNFIRDEHYMDGIQGAVNLSLDEFMCEYHEQLNPAQKTEGYALLESFSVIIK